MAKNVKFKLDGREVEAPEGQLVIEAAKDAGIEIPHYCYHPGLGNPGVCRLCVCEVEGAPKPQMTCRTAVKEGLAVRTNSPAARRAQAASLEFHLANHPLDCPVCDQAGECQLQDYYQKFGLYKSTVREDKLHKEKRKDIGRTVMLDQERCIQCTRCVRFCDEITKTHELGVFGRGDRSVLDVTPGMRLDNAYSGCTVDVCPVGALTDKDFRFAVRVWYLDSTPSVCTGCARGCNIEVHTNTKRPWHTDGRRVARFKPRFNADVNKWWICDEGRYSYKSADASTRLRASSALVDGQPVQKSFEEACAGVAAALKDRDPKGLAFILSGTMTNEDLSAARELIGFLEVPSENVVVAPDESQLGEEDDLLRRKEKVPNLVGAQRLGFSLANSLQALTMTHQVKGFWGVWVVDREPGNEWDGLPVTIWQGPNAVRFTAAAKWVLAASHHVEEDASVTNFEGRVQRLQQAVPPLGESRPDREWFSGVLAALGGVPAAEEVAA